MCNCPEGRYTDTKTGQIVIVPGHDCAYIRRRNNDINTAIDKVLPGSRVYHNMGLTREEWEAVYEEMDRQQLIWGR